jgi:hypothetical protein
MSKPYRATWKLFGRYWRLYGGTRALVTSPYLHLALVVSASCYAVWSVSGWWQTVQGILPNLLGFTLGGYALVMGLGSDKFRKLISGPRKLKPQDAKEGASLFLRMSANFVHFVLVQVMALLAAILAGSMNAHAPPGSWIAALLGQRLTHVACLGVWFCGFTLFVYALLSALAATMAVFRFTQWIDEFNQTGGEEEESEPQPAATAPAGKRVPAELPPTLAPSPESGDELDGDEEAPPVARHRRSE